MCICVFVYSVLRQSKKRRSSTLIYRWFVFVIFLCVFVYLCLYICVLVHLCICVLWAKQEEKNLSSDRVFLFLIFVRVFVFGYLYICICEFMFLVYLYLCICVLWAKQEETILNPDRGFSLPHTHHTSLYYVALEFWLNSSEQATMR